MKATAVKLYAVAAMLALSACSPDWHSGFEDGSSTPDEWSFWGQGQENLYGVPQIVNAQQEGLGPAPDGSNVIKLYHAPNDPTFHHKLYKSWTQATWPRGQEPHDRSSSPSDVSGDYSCKYYIPAAHLHLPNDEFRAINVAQFKEDFFTTTGEYRSHAQWVVQLTNKDYQPTLELVHQLGGQRSGQAIDYIPYLDRWFTLSLRIYQGDRIEWRMDGQLIATGRQSEWPVGHYRPGMLDDALEPGAGPSTGPARRGVDVWRRELPDRRSDRHREPRVPG